MWHLKHNNQPTKTSNHLNICFYLLQLQQRLEARRQARKQATASNVEEDRPSTVDSKASTPVSRKKIMYIHVIALILENI